MNTQYVESSYQDGKVSYSWKQQKPTTWTPLSEISINLQYAAVVSEDWAFFQHEGFDFNQIEEVLKKAATTGKISRGASTISQQVIKNLFLTPDKTVVRKLKEFALTYYMEKVVPKKKILEFYLNVIEFGKGLYGSTQASRFYFNKSVKALTLKESAFLIMLLPNPKVYSQSFRQKELSPYAKETVEKILYKMTRAHFIDEEVYKSALAQRLSFEQKGSGNDDLWEDSFYDER